MSLFDIFPLYNSSNFAAVWRYTSCIIRGIFFGGVQRGEVAENTKRATRKRERSCDIYFRFDKHRPWEYWSPKVQQAKWRCHEHLRQQDLRTHVILHGLIPDRMVPRMSGP